MSLLLTGHGLHHTKDEGQHFAVIFEAKIMQWERAQALEIEESKFMSQNLLPPG